MKRFLLSSISNISHTGNLVLHTLWCRNFFIGIMLCAMVVLPLNGNTVPLSSSSKESLSPKTETITFFFKAPAWLNHNPHNPQIWEQSSGSVHTMSSHNCGENWWSVSFTVPNASTELTYQLRIGDNGTTKYQKAFENFGANPTFTTATTEIWIDGSDGSDYSWNNEDFYLPEEKITEKNPNTLGWQNLQWPPDGNILPQSEFIVYARAFIDGMTGACASGSIENLTVEIGYSTTDASLISDFEGTSWNWVEATLNDHEAGFGNNSQYSADIGSQIEDEGTYFYVSRFQYESNGEKSDWLYGGYSGSGGGEWNGTENVSGELEVKGEELYEITVAEVVDGTAVVEISPSTTVAAAEVVTIDITDIESGKGVALVEVIRDSDSQPVTLTSGTPPDTQYTFSMPDDDVTVTVTLEDVYEITVAQVVNGTAVVEISPSTTVAATKEVTIDIYDIQSGKGVASVEVIRNSDSQPVTLTSGTPPDTQYTFSMPDDDVTVTVTLADITWANVQFPESGTAGLDDTEFLVYARVFIDGKTGPSPDLENLEAWIGFNTTNATETADFDDPSWTWVEATLNDYDLGFGNNSEYYANILSPIDQAGTYYYVSRFQYDGGTMVYGGYSESDGGFWDGTTNVSGELTIHDIGFVNIRSQSVSFPYQDATGADIHALVYIEGITDNSVNPTGVESIRAWIGYHPTDTDPDTWDEQAWQEADFVQEGQGLSNNDHEYRHNAGDAPLLPGKYYYTSRFQYGEGDYYYGGYSESGGGFWDVTNNVSGELIIYGITAEPTGPVQAGQPFDILVENATNQAGDLLTGTFPVKVTVATPDKGDILFEDDVTFSDGEAIIQGLILNQSGTFDLEVEVTDNGDTYTYTLKDIQSAGFDVSAAQVQYPTNPFTISITNATPGDGNPLQGSVQVSASSIDGGFVGEGLLFDEAITFTDGSANFEVVLNEEGSHRIEVSVDGIGVQQIDPDLFVVDFSGFGIQDVVDDVYENIPFDLVLTGATDVTGAIMQGERNVVVTSNKVPGDEVVFDATANFVDGEATVQLTLENGNVEHTLAVTVEGILSTRVKSVEVKESQAGFAVAFKDDITGIVAGVEFTLEISSAIDGAGDLLNGTHTVLLSSNQLPLSDSPVEAEVSFSSGQGELIINETGTDTEEIVIVAQDHIFTVQIPTIGVSEDSPTLEVEPEDASELRITQQPQGNEGTFDNTPTLIGHIVVISTDKFGNQTDKGLDRTSLPFPPFTENKPEVRAFIKTGPDGAQLTGTGAGVYELEINEEGVVEFPDLMVDKDGEYILEFECSDSNISDKVDTEPFTMFHVEPQDGFVIRDPGPQVQNLAFAIELEDAKDTFGELLDDISKNVTVSYEVDDGFGGTFTKTIYNKSTSFSGGLAILEDSGLLIEDLGFIDLTITVEDLGSEVITLEVLATDGSGFDIAFVPAGPYIIGSTFGIEITNAQDVSGTSLEGNYRVWVTSELATEGDNGLLFAGELPFTGGEASVGGLQLFQSGDQELTVEVEWVKTPVTETVTIQEGITLADSQSNPLSPDDPPLVFTPLTIGYTAGEAGNIAETITISRLGGVDVTHIDITVAGGNFQVSGPEDTELDDTTPTTTFALQPETGLGVGVYTDDVQVSYEINGTTGSLEFPVSFEVLDSYLISLEESPSGDPVNPGDELQFTAETNFAPVPASRTIQVNNTGTGIITGLQVFLSGADIGAFEAPAPLSSTISPAGSTTFDIEPKIMSAAGTYTATVNITADNDVQQQFHLRYVVATSGIEITLNPVDELFLGVFSEGYQPADARISFTVNNTGDQDITQLDFAWESVEEEGAPAFEFDLSEVSYPVTPGSSATVYVSPLAGAANNGTFLSDILTVTPNNNEIFEKELNVSFLVDHMLWEGNVNTNWNVNENWRPQHYSPGPEEPAVDDLRQIPNRFVKIIIPDKTVVIRDANVRTGNITLENGATLTVQNNRTLTLEDNAGEVVFGSIAENSPSATVTIAFNGFLVNNKKGDVMNDDEGVQNFGVININGIFSNNGLVNNMGTTTLAGSMINASTATFNNNAAGSYTITNGTLTNSGTFANLGSLTVKPGARLTSNPGATLSNASGNVDSFVIESDNTGTGSVILNNTGVYASVQRWMTARQYYMVSPPVKGQNIMAFLNDDANSGISFASGSGNYAVRKYGEGGWGPLFNLGAGSSAQNIGVNDVFEIGRAYAIRLTPLPSGTVTFRGELEFVTQNMTLTTHTFGWNGLGNPFASSMSVAQASNSLLAEYGDLLDEEQRGLWIWDASIGEYFIINEVPVDQSHIAVAQGFIVKSKPAGGTLNLRSVYRAHQNPTFHKNEEVEEEWHILRLWAHGNEQQWQTIVAFNQHMSPGLDPGYDAGMFHTSDDSFVLFTQMPEDTTGLRLSVQALPDTDIEQLVIPVGFSWSDTEIQQTPITFSMQDLGMPHYLKPILYDMQEDVYTHLSTEAYTTSVGVNEDPTGRFFLTIKDLRNYHPVSFEVTEGEGTLTASTPEGTLESGEWVRKDKQVTFTAQPEENFRVLHWKYNQQTVDDFTGQEFTIESLTEEALVQVAFVYDPKDHALDIISDHKDNDYLIFVQDHEIIIRGLWEENTQALLYDVSGRRVISTGLTEGPENRITVKGLHEGVYILHIRGAEHNETKRLYIR